MAEMNNDRPNYLVGYKKPPTSGQFKKGRSGNDRGRPRGSRNLKTDLLEELNEKVPLTIYGKLKKISKQRLTIKSLVANAAKGDIRAATKVFDLLLKLTQDDEPDTPGNDLSDSDKEILAAFLERHGKKS
jgi:hypothetical protein